ncbi:MAG: flagellar biosynthesis protein FlhF [Phycisphaerales bacterium]|nr:flagellar biosynthesis protein FlhF [Phycisphaerales bacterium]
MKLKTYQAYTMAEALAAVKRDLGAGAVILNTRSYQRGGLFKIGGRTIVELTATSGEDAATPRPAVPGASRPPRPRPARNALQAYAGGAGVTGGVGLTGLPGLPGPASRVASVAAPALPDAVPGSDPDDDGERTRRLAKAMLAQHEQRTRGRADVPASPPPPVASVARMPTEPSSEPPAPRESAESAAAAAEAVAQRYLLTSLEPGVAAAIPGSGSSSGSSSGSGSDPVITPAVPSGIPPAASTGRPESGTVPDTPAMQDELSAIRTMVSEVLQRQVARSGMPTPAMPPQLFETYLTLVGQEVSSELADRIINETRDELTASELEDPERVRALVRERLAEYVPAADEAVAADSPDGRPLTIALVGPTGVGKTTTLAKLAASFKLRHGRRVGLITADTYRIAAVDQLRTYANIIGLPLQVALTPNEMRQAVLALSACDVILIDTAGRSQNDAGRLEELKQFLAAAEPHEVHLVLSSTAGEKVLMHEAEAFGAVGVDKVVLTKLDEAVSFGVLVNVVRKIGKSLSFFTTGQEVPDHLEVSRPQRLAGLVLGEPLHE